MNCMTLLAYVEGKAFEVIFYYIYKEALVF